MNLNSASLLEIIDAIKNGSESIESVWAHFSENIQKDNEKYQAFTAIRDNLQVVDTAGPLAGVPIAVKDLYSEQGVQTSASSKMLENYEAPYNATSIQKLVDAGMNSLGKVTMDEFAMGGSGKTSALAVANNPHDLSRIPGGSSSGSAVAVAAGLAPAALGTDTGGSIRQPASMCGVVGFKPTYGRISRYGVIAMASSLDTMGTLTRTVRDAGFLYEIMAGKDEKDATSIDADYTLPESTWSGDIKGMKVGLPKEYFVEGIDEGVRKVINESIEKLRSMGAEIVDVSLPHTKYGLAAYYIIMPAEASTNLGRYDGVRYGHTTDETFEDYADWVSKTRSEGFGDEVKRRIMIGSHVLSSGFYDAYYRKATAVRELIRQDFIEAYKQVDVIVTPTAPTVAWKHGAMQDPVTEYLADIYTVQASLAQIPGISVPAGMASPADDASVKLPVGLQILGPHMGEEQVLRVAHAFEISW